MAVKLTPRAQAHVTRLDRIWEERPGLVGWITTTDHKRIALLYLFTTLITFGFGGAEAIAMRTQLAVPNGTVLSPEQYDQFFTMHGVTMVFFFIIPVTTGVFGNYLIPLMVGSRDMAFPRLNALGYWWFVGGAIFIYVSFFLGVAPNAGWFNYTPLSGKQYDPGSHIDFYTLGLIFNGLSSTITSINIIITCFKMRAPGMSLNRMPLFCYAFLAVSFALVFALPSLTAATAMLYLERNLGFHFFDAAAGGTPLLWQHLFWIFGHPEVYIIILPAFGIATSIIPTFTHHRMVAFPLVAVAEILVAFIGFGVWAHHMLAVGLSTTTIIYFTGASMIVTIPSAIQIFAWIATIASGKPRFDTPLLWIVGFIVYFIIGGLTGIMVAAIPFDQQVTDTYFVVAHFHFIIFGAAVFPVLAGLYFWFPKVTGRTYYERWGKASFWVTALGTMVTFFPMHIVGLIGMPRRQYTYPSGMGWSGYNLAETIGAYIIAIGLIMVFVNLGVSIFRGRKVGSDPWGGDTLEWSTTSPPPPYNYPVIPRVSSAYPMWDADDREADQRKLEEGVMVLGRGHEAAASTALDAEWDEILAMPSDSPWPIVVGAMTAGVFAMLVTFHYMGAFAFGLAALLATAAWHWKEPGTA